YRDPSSSCIARWIMNDRPPPRLRTPDRQLVLPALALEDLLDTDHQARVVWDFCLGLDLQPLFQAIPSREAGPGPPPISPPLSPRARPLPCGATPPGMPSAPPAPWPGCALTTTPSAGCAAASPSTTTPCRTSALATSTCLMSC